MKKLLFLSLLSLLLALGMTGKASASALTLVDVSGTWSNVDGANVTPGGEPIMYGNGLENQVWWGVPHDELGNGMQSGLGFTGSTPNNNDFLNPFREFDFDEAFEIGQLQHFNNVINLNSAATSADLTIQLTFSNPPELNGDYAFTFDITETLNATGSSPEDDDIIGLGSSFAEETYDIKGTLYTLQLLGFGPDANNLMDQFQTVEGQTSTTLMWGRITTAPAAVPEPATMLLLGSGLIGLFGIRRKFRKS